MKKDKIKVLWCGDAVVPTGFSRVNHSIMQFLPREDYDIIVLGVNYYGDPHEYSYLKIYPASTKGHIYGYNRIKEFADKDFDLIFILNDSWIVHDYLNEIKNSFKKFPKIVVYMPIDSKYPDAEWFKNYPEMVSKLVVYTQYGYDTIKEEVPDLDIQIIPHGINSGSFYKLPEDRQIIKSKIFPASKDFIDSFIVLNVNRNQPRKRIDIAFEGFAIFSKDKPRNVRYYHHAGISDVGYDILRLAKKLGKRYTNNLEERLIVTNMNRGVQNLTDDRLNYIYNSCDIGINTSLGEGWGLCNIEHAITKAAQVVPDHSACKELFHDCGLLIPTSQDITFEHTLTVGRIVKPEEVALKLEEYYQSSQLVEEMAEKAYTKFTSPEYSWETISKQWDKLFKEVLK